MPDKTNTFSELVALRAGLCEISNTVEAVKRARQQSRRYKVFADTEEGKLAETKAEYKKLHGVIQNAKGKPYTNGFISISDAHAPTAEKLKQQREELKSKLKNPKKPTYKEQMGIDGEDAFIAALIIAGIFLVISFLVLVCMFQDEILYPLVGPWVVAAAIFAVTLLFASIIHLLKKKQQLNKATKKYKKDLKSDSEPLRKIAELEKQFENYVNSGKYVAELESAEQELSNRITEKQTEAYKNREAQKSCEKAEADNRKQVAANYKKLVQKYAPLLHQSDFDKLDYILYLFDTNRCDTMREALLQLDEQKRNDRIVSSINEAQSYISTNITKSIGALGDNIRHALAGVACALDDSVRTNNAMLGAKIAQLESSFKINIDKSCKQLVESIDSLSTETNVDVYIDNKRIG